jgi:glucosamine--fructose-6-phosphate aminotransferase (isomerizing)
VFPPTVVLQRLVRDLSEARGVSPDRFRYEEDVRCEAAFEALGF